MNKTNPIKYKLQNTQHTKHKMPPFRKRPRTITTLETLSAPSNIPPENRYWISPETVAAVQTYIGPSGYTIMKVSLPPTELKKITTALTARPNLGGPVPSRITYPVYRETADKLFIPYYFARDVGFPPAPKSYLSEGVTIDVPFAGTLRESQAPVLLPFLDMVQNSPHPIRGGMLNLPCGWGKTAGTMYCISKIRKRTLVLINQNNLADQWVERARDFLPSATIGRIQGDVFDIEKDIVIAVINTIYSKTYPPNTFASFGLLVVDEAHFIGSKEFSKALKILTMPITLGLSATKERKDGLMWMIRQYIGPVLCSVARDDVNIDVQIRTIYYQPPTPDPEFMAPILSSTGDLMMSSMISKICKYKPYIRFVLDTLTAFIRTPEWTAEAQQHWQHMLSGSAAGSPCRRCHSVNTRLVRAICCGESAYCYTCMTEMLNPPDKSTILRTLVALSSRTSPARYIGTIPNGVQTFSRLLQGKTGESDRHVLLELIGNIVEHCSTAGDAFCKQARFMEVLFQYAQPDIPIHIRRAAERTLCQFAQSGGFPRLKKVQLEKFPAYPFEFAGFCSEATLVAEDAFSLSLATDASATASATSATATATSTATATDAPQQMEEKRMDELLYFLEGKQCPCCHRKTKIGFEQDYLENNLVEPFQKRQTIVFANCRQILLDLYQTIIEKNIASVGLYIGNPTDTREMQKKKLKDTESKQIILATYSMAGTGLDIPTLNAAFFITSKSDIEQPAGRPMRKAHVYPTVIYDIVWPHACFRRQYAKRKAYYKKNNYQITETRMSTGGNAFSSSSGEEEDNVSMMSMDEINELIE